MAECQRAHEAPQHGTAPAHVLLARDDDQLVVGRHADVVHLQDARVLLAPLQLDALDVPERAERRVDLLGQHRGHEVEADVDRVHALGVDAGLLDDRLQVGVLVGDPGRADLLVLELPGLANGL